MSAALVMTEFGLQVRRFPSSAAAKAAAADRETCGVGITLQRVVCAWCGKQKAPQVCDPKDAHKISDGMCPTCQAWMMADLDATVPVNDAASGKVGPVRHSQVNGTAAHGESAAMDNPSGSPVASFTFKQGGAF